MWNDRSVEAVYGKDDEIGRKKSNLARYLT